MTKPMDEINWQEVETGGVITSPGTPVAIIPEPGDPRSRRISRKNAFDVALLHHVPDAAISADYENNRMVWNFDYCKGCGICAYECPVDAIEMVEEGK